MERVAEYYQQTGNAAGQGDPRQVGRPGRCPRPRSTRTAPSRSRPTLQWSGQPDTWNASSPGANTGLHVTVADYTNDVGVAAAYAKTLTYYAAKSGNADGQDHGQGAAGRHVGQLPGRPGHRRPGDPRPTTTASTTRVYVPSGCDRHDAERRHDQLHLDLPSLRSFYKNDPAWSKVAGLPERRRRARRSPTTASGPRRTSPWPWARTRSFSNKPPPSAPRVGRCSSAGRAWPAARLPAPLAVLGTGRGGDAAPRRSRSKAPRTWPRHLTTGPRPGGPHPHRGPPGNRTSRTVPPPLHPATARLLPRTVLLPMAFREEGPPPCEEPASSRPYWRSPPA